MITELNKYTWGYIEAPFFFDIDRYQKWLSLNLNASLKYMERPRYFDFSAALVFLFPYSPVINEKIASYALAFDTKDYHLVIKEKLSSLNIEGQIVVDSFPVFERELAYKAGLGFYGKNTMLINNEFGSYFFIGAILLKNKLELPLKKILQDTCIGCDRCINECPTKAITKNGIDCSKCISAYTIETFKDIPPPEGYKKTPYIFGCDICQKVCPHNFSLNKVHIEGPDLLSISNMSLVEFKINFRGTSFVRTGKNGILKNIKNK